MHFENQRNFSDWLTDNVSEASFTNGAMDEALLRAAFEKLMDWRNLLTGETMNQLLEPVILAIDSDEVALALVKTLLESHGMIVFTAQDIGAAVEIARENIIDLIICDMQVHDKSGLEIAAAIRTLPQRHDVPSLFMSAVQTPDIIHRRHQNSSAFHIKKPFEKTIFVELVDRALWMPHLVDSHIQAFHDREELAQPHFPLGVPIIPTRSPSTH